MISFILECGYRWFYCQTIMHIPAQWLNNACAWHIAAKHARLQQRTTASAPNICTQSSMFCDLVRGLITILHKRDVCSHWYKVWYFPTLGKITSCWQCPSSNLRPVFTSLWNSVNRYQGWPVWPRPMLFEIWYRSYAMNSRRLNFISKNSHIPYTYRVNYLS